MAVTARPTHLPPIDAHNRAEAGRELQATLVELVDLSLVGKQLHWCIVGPLFQPLHERLDVLVDSWRELADRVAERAVALGVFPDGQAQTIAAESSLPKLDAAAITDAGVIRDLARRLADVAERTRARMDKLGDLDLASQDVLIEVVRALEEQLWMTRSQLPHPAGE